MRGGLIFLQVHPPQSSRPLRFILDSGASVSVLHLETARELGLRLGEAVPVSGVGSRVTGFWPVSMRSQIGEMCLPTKFLAIDLKELSMACAEPIDGLLGADFFEGKAVQLNFKESSLRILRAEEILPNERGIRLKRARNVMLVPVQVDGSITKWARLDTGCASALEWVEAKSNKRAVERRMSVGLATINQRTACQTVSVGSFTLTNVQVGLHEQAIFKGESGLLGTGFLREFGTVTFDYANGRLVLQTKG